MAEFMSNHAGLSFFIILFCVLGAMIIYYGNMVATLVKWSKKPRRSKDGKKIRCRDITLQQRWKCYIPLYQCCYAHITLWKSYGPWLVISIISIVLIVLRLLNVFLLPINGLVMLVTAIGMYLGCLLLMLTYMVVTARIAYVYGFNFLVVIVSVLLPPLGAWWMSNKIPGVMRSMYREETFHEHKSETIIKSRNNE